ncbi:MAG: hypothetical protein AAFS10_04685 [Myxococcota bacterium]
MLVHLLVTPLTQGAFFDHTLDVAHVEFSAHFPGIPVGHLRTGTLDFLTADLPDDGLAVAARLACVQGMFRVDEAGRLTPLDLQPDFRLPPSLVYGAKYRGKTHELVTQLALNVAVAHCRTGSPPQTLLDPMAGRGTTLLWGLRYGLHGRGIEQDQGALDDLHRHIKRQTKLHRIKHEHHKGFVGKKTKEGPGRFVHYTMAGRSLRLIAGDSRLTPKLLGKQRFDLIVSDLPYGIQFKGKGRRQSVLDLIEGCAQGWVASLRDGGAMVLIFNTYQPNRDALAALFTSLGCRVEAISAPHRMSESIVRDLLVLTKPLSP